MYMASNYMYNTTEVLLPMNWRASSNPLTKGTANSLPVTSVLLVIFSFCLCALYQCFLTILQIVSCLPPAGQ